MRAMNDRVRAFRRVILSNLGGNKFKLLSETLITKQFIMRIKKARIKCDDSNVIKIVI